LSKAWRKWLLPFVDVLYIRCDWRDVQKGPWQLTLSPVWDITFDAAKRHNLVVGFRTQLYSPNIQPQELSMPDFLQDKVPIVNIGHKSKRHQVGFDFRCLPRTLGSSHRPVFIDPNHCFGAVWAPAAMILVAGGHWWKGLILLGCGAGVVGPRRQARMLRGGEIPNRLRPITLKRHGRHDCGRISLALQTTVR
jgi:hypothetical protein